MGIYELKKEELKLNWDMIPKFSNTSEISYYTMLIGQERAVEALDLALLLDIKGYNVYVSGSIGTGKRSYAIKRIKEYAKKMPVPNDWCYVYNFIDNNKPLALKLEPGTAVDFKSDIEGLIYDIVKIIPELFTDNEYEGKKNGIIDIYQKKVIIIIDKLYEDAKAKGFNVKSIKEGFAFVPVKDGVEMNEVEYNNLSDEERNRINTDLSYLKLNALEVLKQTKIIKNDMLERLRIIDEGVFKGFIDNKIENLIYKYEYENKIVEYIMNLKKDIIENMSIFMINEDEDEEKEELKEDFLKRYSVNVIVYSKDSNGAPVIYESYNDYHNLIGTIEYENKSGGLITDFTKIRPGSFHRANGGYLILEAEQLLKGYMGWEVLKKCLKKGYIEIGNFKNQFDILPIINIMPEEIPLDIKVILIGTSYIYNILYKFDEDFRELFKIKADFEDDIKNEGDIPLKMLGFISYYCSEKNIPPITRDGVLEILKFSLRLGESRNYFTAAMYKILELIEQAAVIVKHKNKNIIEKSDIKSSIEAKEKRHGLYKDRILEMYKEGKYIIELDGYRIGQINGLSIIEFGDTSFGKINRITANTFAGRDGIINIEREANMSGDIHSKGVMILSGYIGETFGQIMPLSFSSSICFEQLYGEIDGDSASAAELAALLSSLGDVPLNQSIAMTGSVNQKGEMQPIGGVNEKVEGFFDICSMYGLDGSHGVIIPYSNMDELILKDELIDAVEKELFHIYTIKNIEDCFDILCPIEATVGNIKKFTVIKEKVFEKLLKYKSVFYEKSKK